MPLNAIALNCTIKPGGEPSSTELLLTRLMAALAEHDVAPGPIIRVIDEGVAFGVSSDEGEGDGWPAIREKILAAQILVIGTPIWLGNPSSVCRQVLERLDAFISEEDDRGRPIASDRVAVLATVGNEDGAHNVAAQVYQALSDVGFTIPAGGQTYWVGEAMGSVDYKDLDAEPDDVASTTRDVARNATHLARLLQQSPYPA
jgi:multimeric flavodoxin WrbA